MNKWYTALVNECRGTTIAFQDMLKVSASDKNLEGFLGQVLYGVALHLEDTVYSALTNVATAYGSLRVDVIDPASLFNDPKALGTQLLKHVMSGQEAFTSSGGYFYSCANDKANVGGLTINNMFWVIRNNNAIVACPQAAGWAKEITRVF
jgi:hypothetical protein